MVSIKWKLRPCGHPVRADSVVNVAISRLIL